MQPKAKFYFELAVELEKLNNGEAKEYFRRAAKINDYYKNLAPYMLI